MKGGDTALVALLDEWSVDRKDDRCTRIVTWSELQETRIDGTKFDYVNSRRLKQFDQSFVYPHALKLAVDDSPNIRAALENGSKNPGADFRDDLRGCGPILKARNILRQTIAIRIWAEMSQIGRELFEADCMDGLIQDELAKRTGVKY
jgi:hypothetical protein